MHRGKETGVHNVFYSVLAAGILHYTEFGLTAFIPCFQWHRVYALSQPTLLFLDFVEILLCTCSIFSLIFLLIYFYSLHFH